jgi:hypothetical protein
LRKDDKRRREGLCSTDHPVGAALALPRPSERGARWEEFENLNGSEPLWRIGLADEDLDRKDEIGGDHLVPLVPQSVAVLRALWPLTGGGNLLLSTPG